MRHRTLSSRGTGSKSSGVSRVSLLLTVVIVLLLSSLLVLVRGNLRAESRRELCRSRLGTLGKNFEAYSARYGQYPSPGPESWFGLLLRSGIAENADQFLCPFEESGGVRGQYLGIIDAGSDIGICGGATFTWTKEGMCGLLPLDLEMAADRKMRGIPSHGSDGTRFILYGSGRVDTCVVGSYSDARVDERCKEGWFGDTK